MNAFRSRPLAAAVIVFVGAATLATSSPAQSPTSRADALDQYLRACTRFGFAGSVLVVRGGETLLAKGYGVADPATERPNSPDTLFEIASATKQFTAAAILKLAEQERLTLDDRISQHLPGVPKSCDAITIRHLLTHTSGIPRSNARGRGDDLAAATSAFLEGGPKAKPGETFAYWNGGYALLAGIVERASGETFTAFCETQLFAPAGMTDTGFTGDADLDRTRAAVGIAGAGEPRSALDHPYGSYGYQYKGMGGAVTTVLDLRKWDIALRSDLVLSARSREALFTPAREGYALGWMVSSSRPRTASHGGAVRGFLTEFARELDRDGCTVVLCNRDDLPLRWLVRGIDAIVAGTPHEMPPPPVPVALSEAELAGIAGTYRVDDEQTIELVVDGDAIRARPSGLLASMAFAVPRDAARSVQRVESAAKKAVAIVTALAKGDAVPLREAMAPGIPTSWPNVVVSELWPEHERLNGALASVRAEAARGDGRRTEVVLALQHESGVRRVLVALQDGKVQRLIWKGVAATETVLVPVAADELRGHAWSWQPRVELVRKGDRVVAIEIGGVRARR